MSRAHAHSHGEGCQNIHINTAVPARKRLQKETIALLTYMLQHNEHHAQELDQMAGKSGQDGAGSFYKRAIHNMHADSERSCLGLALTLVKRN